MKRTFDFVLSLLVLIFLSPVLLLTMFLVWIQDLHSPFYISSRVGKGGVSFKMVKLRSMVKNADETGVDSTSDNDNRITNIGRLIRKYKIDEIFQLWNVIIGDMSLVGPRPNVRRETDLYTKEEKKIFMAKPGITDFSSIIFADLGDILSKYDDADIAYNQLVRPWKSRLGILYIEKSNLLLDIRLICYTGLSILSRKKALDFVNELLIELKAEKDLIKISKRDCDLIPTPPLGSHEVVISRNL
jgi:lipopolysaccharide/colanic/teichoic acid biosynthesis glycosyltransferase